MTISVDGGGAAGGNLPSPKNYALELARDLASRAGLTYLSDRATLMLRKPGEISYQDDRYGDGAESAVVNAALLGKVTRTGKALIPNWSFRSGTKVGPLRVADDDELRFNEPPEDEYAPGPLIETSGGTNKNRNPLFLGARQGALDSSGVLPTYMSITGLADSAVSVVAFGRLDNWPFIRLRLNGTPSADPRIIFEETGQIAAVTTNDVCVQHGVAIYDGDLTNITSLVSVIHERTAAGASVQENTEAFTPTAEHLRFFFGETLSGGGTVAAVTHEIGVDWDGSGAIDITLDIFLPDIKIGSTEPSSPVTPSTDVTGESSRGAETRNGGFQCERDGRAIGFEWDGTNGGLVSPAREYYKHSPVSEGCVAKGMPATVNKVPNPLFIGAATGVIGSGGSLGTGLTLSDGGLTWEVVQIRTEGRQRILRIEVTGNPTGDAAIGLSARTAIAAATGQYWTASFGFRILKGVCGTPQAFIYERDSGGALVVSGAADLVGADSRWRRWFYSRQLSGGGTVAHVQPTLYFNNPVGPGLYCLFEIAIPQIENLPYPTPPALPDPGTTGEASRAATATYFPSGGHTEDDREGTIYARMRINYLPAAGNYPRALSFGSNGSSEIGLLLNGDTSALEVALRVGSVIQANASKTIAVGDIVDVAIAFNTNDIAISFNGETQTLDSSASIAIGGSRFEIGASPDGSGVSGPVEILQLWYAPTRLPDAEGEDLVGNS